MSAGKPAPDDIARHYERSHERIVELVTSLSADQAATQVAATPGWDVHDVLAHLAAITTDALAGRLTGLPTDEFTHEQVRERRAASIVELVAEWQGNLGQMMEVTRTGLVPPNLAVDAVTHEQDIRGAIGAPRVPDPEAVRFCLDLYGAGAKYRLHKEAAPALRIEATDGDYTLDAGDGVPDATLRATEFELFRTLCGRRGREQVMAMDWDGDASGFVNRLNIFGAVPDYAVVD
jgi:uncharacterized protein (TIGR03083 family)